LEYTPYGELWIDWQSNDAIDSTPFRFTGKERDPETSLYYFGARYLDPKTSRWLSVDPALTDGSYIPIAPNSDEAKKHNQNLPGLGGVFNYVNLHVYHYGANNPIRYVDPNGRTNRPLNSEEGADVKHVIDYAITNLDTIINELTAYTSGASESISDEIKQSASHWFGIDLSSKEKARTFAEDLGKIKNRLEAIDMSDFSYDTNLGNDVAKVNVFTGQIKLSPEFFLLQDYGGLATKLGTLVHEVSHIRSVLNTSDHAYGPNPSRRLAINSPNTAYRNADNWGFFLEKYVNDRRSRR
jgi:RHS repeat-associated protein